jgi:hypothetical protein
MAEVRIESLEEHRSNIPRWWYLVSKVTCYTLPIFQTKSKGPLRLLRLKGWRMPGCTPPLHGGRSFQGRSRLLRRAYETAAFFPPVKCSMQIAFAGEARPRDVISGA